MVLYLLIKNSFNATKSNQCLLTENELNAGNFKKDGGKRTNMF